MDSGSEVMIQVRDLTCAYGDFVVVDSISFDVHRGEVLIILGGSGSGKSTVLKHMIGQYVPAQGQVLFRNSEGGYDDMAQADETLRLSILRRFGVMYQMGALFGSMTLLENVRLPLEEFTDLPPEAMNEVARMKLSLVGLADSCHKMPAELSGGMQKRAAIARAMALDPPMLFLDEPSAGLDPITSAGLDDLILDLARDLGITFVIVSHELASIFNIADRVVMLDKRVKKLVAEGPPRELRDTSDNPFVQQFFKRMAKCTSSSET